MMRRSAGVLILVAISVLALRGEAGSQEQLEIRKMFLCGTIPPASLFEAVVDAEAVVRVRLIDQRYGMLEGSMPTTHFTADVIEHVKTRRGTPPSLQIYRFGGVAHTPEGSYRLVASGYPDFAAGEEYILFLDWNENVGAFSTRGPDLAFLVDSATDVVLPLGGSGLSTRLRGRSAGEVMAELRELAR
jgi:hypothetical protein